MFGIRLARLRTVYGENFLTVSLFLCLRLYVSLFISNTLIATILEGDENHLLQNETKMQSKIYIRHFDYFNYPIKNISVFFPVTTSTLVTFRLSHKAKVLWMPTLNLCPHLIKDDDKQFPGQLSSRGQNRLVKDGDWERLLPPPQSLSPQLPPAPQCAQLSAPQGVQLSWPHSSSVQIHEHPLSWAVMLEKAGNVPVFRTTHGWKQAGLLMIPHQHSPHPVTVSQVFCVPTLLPPWFIKLFFRKEFLWLIWAVDSLLPVVFISKRTIMWFFILKLSFRNKEFGMQTVCLLFWADTWKIIQKSLPMHTLSSALLPSCHCVFCVQFSISI